MDPTLPTLVTVALARATALDFTLSCDPEVGRLLATLAAGVPAGGRILEMGTGAGVGTAWLVMGIVGRDDVELITIEMDPRVARAAAEGPWPPCVRLETGNVLDRLDGLGRFDLIFADAQGGKWQGLDRTIAALTPGGVLVVDDMIVPESASEEHRANQDRVRRTLLAHADLVACELAAGSGIMIATRRRE
jgi:demethylmenaquinone methyltransferase/2-methoxy-6-polyprenyl-1,4-benzoquinol methylase